MRVLDLFSGLEGWSAPARARGHDVTTLDNCEDGDFSPDFREDVLSVRSLSDLERGRGRFDAVFASPPCTAFSVQVIGRNWERGPDGKASTPKTAQARLGLQIALHTFAMILDYAPRFWVVENPVGAMRSVIRQYEQYRDWTAYCQWQKEFPPSQRRMKPTDLWRSGFDLPLPKCEKRASDHASAPRGSKTGTQGLGPPRIKSLIPKALAEAFIINAEHLERK